MKLTSLLLLFLFINRCSDKKNDHYFIPEDFQYPYNKIGVGKTFVYQNSLTKEQTFEDLRTLDIGGKHFETLKSYNANSVNDSVKLLNGKVFETFIFFMSSGGHFVKAETVKDSILNNNLKLGVHVTERKFEANGVQYITTSQEKFLKDTTIIWENTRLPCLVTQSNKKIEVIDKAATAVNNFINVIANFYYAKGIGVIKYSIQFTDQYGKANYGLWELKSIKNINS